MKIIALIIINVILLYLIIGVFFSLYFFVKGAAKIDPLIKDSSKKVRVLLIPGAIVTWVFLLPKVLASKTD